MSFIDDSFGIIFLFFVGLILIYYGIKNRGTEVVKISFVGNGPRMAVYAMLSLSVVDIFFNGLMSWKIIFSIPAFCIILFTQYKDGYAYGSFKENGVEINEIIKKLKANERFREIFDSNPKYDVYLRTRGEPIGKTQICIETGLNVALAEEIRLAMEEDLVKIDDKKIRWQYYVVLGVLAWLIMVI